ncbi:MAG TPA: glycoside hydrolase family 2 protein, partial [Armatimonadota bacterium]|nr:glycoside hydrolase family 2 protein [Armatimonadota bacterium]
QEAPDRLTISSDRFAKGVYLFHPDMKAIFSDNYFDLMPGEERTIRVSCPVNASEVKLYSYHH